MHFTADGEHIHGDDDSGMQGSAAVGQLLLGVVGHDMVKGGCLFAVLCDKTSCSGAHDALIAHPISACITATGEQVVGSIHFKGDMVVFAEQVQLVAFTGAVEKQGNMRFILDGISKA